MQINLTCEHIHKYTHIHTYIHTLYHASDNLPPPERPGSGHRHFHGSQLSLHEILQTLILHTYIHTYIHTYKHSYIRTYIH